MTNHGLRFAILGLALAATSSIADEPIKDVREGKLRCRLIPDKTVASNGSSTAFLEIRNDSREPLGIEYKSNELEHLAIDIRDPDGKSLPKTSSRYVAASSETVP